MKIETIILFLLISSTYSIIFYVIEWKRGTCDNKGYHFTIVGYIDQILLTNINILLVFESLSNSDFFIYSSCILYESNRNLVTNISCTITDDLKDETIGLYQIYYYSIIFHPLNLNNFLLSDVTCPLPNFSALSITPGTCTNNKYKFIINGTLSDAISSGMYIIPTFTSPSTKPSTSCSLFFEEMGDIYIECIIYSALYNDTITLSGITSNRFFVTGLPLTIDRTVTCPRIFTISDFFADIWESERYMVRIFGYLSESLVSDINIIATFDSLTPSYNCTLHADIEASIGSNYIICNITIEIKESNITILDMSGTEISIIGLPITINPDSVTRSSDDLIPIFKASGITIGNCFRDKYRFRVSGILSKPTTSVISITLSFDDKIPDYNCSIPITEEANLGSAYIQCEITSTLNGNTIKVLSVRSYDIFVKGLPVTMIGTATCNNEVEAERSSEDEGKDENRN